MPKRSTTASASAKVLASGTVGPEPITAGSSPGTSEITSVTTLAGCAAAARRPPLIAERCLRTTFIWPMSAPEASRARLSACLSSRLMPGAGRLSRAEAPPEIRHSTRSSAPADFGELEHARGRLVAGGIGHRVGRLDHLDSLTRRAMAVARDHQALDRPGHVLLDLLGHGGRGLACAQHDGAARGRWRQMRRDRARRAGRRDRGIQHAAQPRLVLDHGHDRAHRRLLAPAALYRARTGEANRPG